MPFEGVPVTGARPENEPLNQLPDSHISIDAVESRREQVQTAIRHKIAEIDLLPETAISSQIRQKLNTLVMRLSELDGRDVMLAMQVIRDAEAAIQTFGINVNNTKVNEPTESLGVANTPALEQITEVFPQSVEVQGAAFNAHMFKTEKAINAFFDKLVKESLRGNGSETVAKRKALKYARIDYHKWEQIAKEITRLRDDQIQRRGDLTALLQSHYNALAKNVNAVKPDYLPSMSYTVPAREMSRDVVGRSLESSKSARREVLLSEVSEDDISEKTASRLVEIENKINTLAHLDSESQKDLSDMVAHVRRILSEYDELAEGKFYPDRYAEKTVVLQKSMDLLEESLASVTENEVAQPEVVIQTPEPLVLGAKERIADDEQFEAVLEKLDSYELDEVDENLVRVCTENYQKFRALGENVRAGSYLHNLTEIVNRKEAQKREGTPHGEIAGRLAVIREALKAMEIVDKENAVTISTVANNIERLLGEVATNPEKEKALQQTYQSLEVLYKNAMTPDEELSSPVSTGAMPVVLEEPNSEALVTNSGAKSSVPRITGVASRELAPNGVLERKNRIWDNLKRRLNTVAKTAVVAIAAMYTTNNETDKNVNAFYGSNIPVSASSISGIGPDAAWATQDPMNLETARLAEESKIEVMPPIARVMEEESSPAVSPVSESVSVPAVSEPLVPSNLETTPTVVDVVSEVEHTEKNLESVAPVVDEKSPEYQATVAPVQPDNNNTAEVLSDTKAAVESTEANTAKPTHIYQVEGGEPSTYVDPLLTRALETIDYQGLSNSLVDQIKAEARAHFLNSPDMIREAGIDSGNPSIVFDKQQIDLSKFVWYVEGEVAKKVKALTDPLAMNQVVEKGDTLTAVAAEAYAPELSEQGISPEGQQQIVAEAVTAQTATPEGLQALGLKDADLIKPGDVIPIGEMAEEVDVVTNDYLSQEDDALQDDNEMAEDSGPTSLTPENYPGGTLSFSRDYNTLLDKLGISVTNPSWVDSMFFSNAPSNRAILDMTVGEFTKIMLGDTNSIINELAARNISTETAQSVYDIVRAGRVTGVIDPTLNAAQTIASVLQMKTMSDARNRDT